MSLAITVLPAILFVFCFFFPKSIQFLYSTGKYDEGKVYLEKLMKNTKSDTSNLDKLALKLERISIRQKEATKVANNGTTFQELVSPNFRLVSLQVCVIFFVACLGNYGFMLNSGNLGGNLLVNNVWMSFFDLLGYFVMAPLMDRFGRVKTLSVSYALTGICIFASSIIAVYATETLAITITSNALGLLLFSLVEYLNLLIQFILVNYSMPLLLELYLRIHQSFIQLI